MTLLRRNWLTFADLKPSRWSRKQFAPISVECARNRELEQEPIAFSFNDMQYKITEIIDRWYEGGIEVGRSLVNYFKIKTHDGKIFILRNDPALKEWHIFELLNLNSS